MLPDDVLSLAARSPAGLFCRKQLFRLGYRDHHIAEWRAEELIERLTCGWYRVTDVDHPVEQCIELPLAYTRYKRVDPLPVLSGHAGLAVWRVPGFDLPCTPLLLTPHSARIRLKDAPWRTRQARVGTLEVHVVRGRRVAGPGRCIADLHEEGIEEEGLITAVDAVRNALRIGLADLLDEWEAIGRRHPGVAVLLRLAEVGTLDVESPGERRTLQQVFERFPPIPDCQVQITSRFRADFAYVFAALILEYYGEEWHRDRVVEDADRISTFRDGAWDVLVITKTQIAQPAVLARRVHTLRREREGLMAAGLIRRPALPAQPRRRLPLRTLVPLG